MTPSPDLTHGKSQETLRSAIEKQTPLTVTWRHEGRWLLLKSRFIGTTEQSDGIILAPLTGDGADGTPRPQNIATGATIDVSFRRGHYKCSFRTTILHVGETLTILRPDTIRQLQRRAFQRVSVPSNVRIPVELQPTSGTAGPTIGATSGASPTIDSYVSDLSAGGLGLRLPKPPSWSPSIGQAFQVTIKGPDRRNIRVSGLYRHCHVDPGGDIQWGLQIVGLDDTETGRTTLDALTQLSRSIRGGTLAGATA